VPDAPWTPQSLACFMQSVLQGSLILAKAKQGPDVAIDALLHLRRYLEMQLNIRDRQPQTQGGQS
jgi:TetR/AcrR family transcriptional repressor of nem operon